MGPVALIYPDGVFYQNIKVPDVAEIVEEHLLTGRVVTRLVSHAPGTDKSTAEMHDVEFFNRQVKIVLRNSGLIDPLKIEDYVARDGDPSPENLYNECSKEGSFKDITEEVRQYIVSAGLCTYHGEGWMERRGVR